MKAPTLRQDGSCPACVGGWQCAFHIAAGLEEDRQRSRTLARVVAGQRENEIARVCWLYELESDEGGTREEKAARLLGIESARSGR